MKLKDLTGQRFGGLTVVKRDGTYVSPDGLTTTPKWLCKCECGNETVVIGRNLKDGRTRSCGCLRKEIRKARKRT